MEENIQSLKQAIVKTMTVNKKTDVIYNFFENMNYLEMGYYKIRITKKGQCWLVDGSTVTWTFIKPDGLGEDQFEKQLVNFDTVHIRQYRINRSQSIMITVENLVTYDI
jgi:hypothetical protein